MKKRVIFNLGEEQVRQIQIHDFRIQANIQRRFSFIVPENWDGKPLTLVKLARMSPIKNCQQVLFIFLSCHRFVRGQEVQNRLAAGKNVETHLNNLLFLNAIKSDCLVLPNCFSNDPVQHSKVEVEMEVYTVSELYSKYLFHDV
jgi:hypothetical protein